MLYEPYIHFEQNIKLCYLKQNVSAQSRRYSPFI